MIRSFNWVIRRALLWTLYFGLVALLPAQQSTGTIIGVIEDGTGSVIPNASVTLVHAATGDSRRARSNERGEFSSPYMRLGEYTFTTEAAGFKKRVESGIVVQVDQTVNLRVALEIGSVTESIEVTGAAPLLDAATTGNVRSSVESSDSRVTPLYDAFLCLTTRDLDGAKAFNSLMSIGICL